MKNIFCVFIVGMVVGGVTAYTFFNKSTPIKAEMTVTSSDPNAQISNSQIIVKKKRRTVEAIASFETDRKGIYTNTITLNRRDLQYSHSLYGSLGYFVQSQTPYINLGYSYRYLLAGVQIGYSFRLEELEYGMSIGGKWSW